MIHRNGLITKFRVIASNSGTIINYSIVSPSDTSVNTGTYATCISVPLWKSVKCSGLDSVGENYRVLPPSIQYDYNQISLILCTLFLRFLLNILTVQIFKQDIKINLIINFSIYEEEFYNNTI